MNTEKNNAATEAMRKAHAMCPSDLAHLDKMRWMGNYVAAAILPTPTAASVASGGEAEIERLRALSVTNILLDVVPGWDGMGHEIYAKSVREVEDRMSEMGERLENFQLGIPAATAQPQPRTQATPITASIMRDDGGDKPAFCVMAAFRTEPEAVAALGALNGLAAQPRTQAEPKRCPYCDDAGDVHSIDGEWRGVCTECTIAAGRAAPPAEQEAAPRHAPSSFVNAAGIHLSDKPATVVRKLDAAFHDAVTFATPTPSQQAAPTPATQAEPALPVMRTAFVTSMAAGGQNRNYQLVFGLPDLQTLDAAHGEWLAFAGGAK